MKNSPSTSSPQLPSAERGSTISVRNAILAILLAYGIGIYGNNHNKKNTTLKDSGNKIVVLVEKNEGGIQEKNMSSAENGLAELGCSGFSNDEAVELGKKLKHERGLAFRDSIIKKYSLTDEEGIADLENAALRGYVTEVEMIYDEEKIMLKLEDDYENDEIVEFPKSGGSFPELDDCQEGNSEEAAGAKEDNLSEKDNKILYI